MFRLFDFSLESILQFLLILPIILISLPVHESAHAYVSYKLGDPTARNLGRITLNPVKHFDLLGFICMLIFRFGWAKPVPINSRNFKKPRRDMALSALAGPASNLLLAFLGVILYNVAILIFSGVEFGSERALSVAWVTVEFFFLFAYLNINLAVFNFIPVPPLDGSRILYVFLPPKWYFGVMKYERYISLAIMLLVFFGLLSGPLQTISSAIFNGMNFLVNLIPDLLKG